MSNKARKRILSAVMALLMVIGMMPSNLLGGRVAVKAEEAERTEWSFRSGSDLLDSENQVTFQGTTGEIYGLKIDATTGKFDSKRSDWAQFNTGTKIQVPVKGSSTITVVGYSSDYTVNGEAGGAAGVAKDFTYEGEAGYVDIVATADTYIGSIKVVAKAPARTEWSFRSGSDLLNSENQVTFQGTTGEIYGLKIDATTGKFDSKRSDWAQFNTGTKVQVPVKGSSTITVVGYSSDYTVNGEAGGAAGVAKDFTYNGEEGYVEIVATKDTYLGSIKVVKTDAPVKPSAGDVEKNVSEDLIDFTNLMKNATSFVGEAATFPVDGVALNNFLYSSEEHGIKAGTGERTIVLNLRKKADIVITECKNGSVVPTASSGAVETTTAATAEVDGVYTVKGAEAGKVTLTFPEGDCFVHSIKVTYESIPAGDIEKPIAKGTYNFITIKNANSSDMKEGNPAIFNIDGLAIDNFVYHKDHGIKGKGGKITVNLAKKSNIIITECRYGTAAVTAGELEVEETVKYVNQSADGIYTIKNAMPGKVEITFAATDAYVHSIEIEEVPDAPEYVEAKDYNFIKDFADMDAVSGIKGAKFVGFSKHADHGITGNGGTIKLNLEKAANITISECMYGTAAVTASAGTVVEAVKCVASTTDGVYAILAAPAGELTINFASGKSEYIHGIKVEYIDAPEGTVAGEAIPFGGKTEETLAAIAGMKLTGMKDYANKHGFGAGTATSQIILNLEKTANITLTGCCYTLKENGNILVNNGYIKRVDKTEENMVAPEFTILEATGLTIITVANGMYVHGINVEYMDIPNVTMSGSVVGESYPASYGISFKDGITGAVVAATMDGNNYTAALKGNRKYTVEVTGASDYIIDGSDEITLEAANVTDKAINIKKVPTVTLTGNVTGIAKEDLAKLKLKFASSLKFEPEFKITDSETGAYTLTLAREVAYTLTAEDVNDYTLDTTSLNVSENGTKDIAFTKKPVYTVATTITGVDTTNAVIRFTNVEDKYEYKFGAADTVKLRDGEYIVKVLQVGNYKVSQDVAANLKVNGANTTLDIKFSPISTWNFGTLNNTSEAKGTTDIEKIDDKEFYAGLILNKILENKVYLTGGNGASITIPALGKGDKIDISYCYSANFTAGDVTASTASNDTSKIESTSVRMAEDGDLVINLKGTTYINSIAVTKAADLVEYVPTIAVGKDKAYKTVNEALAAIKKMDRTAEQNVTVMIDPGNYEEMLVIDIPNITLKNASATPSTALKNKGADIDANAVRITWYYGHGYSYYSMGPDCKYDAALLAANKEAGKPSYKNPGSGTTDGSYWNASVVIKADNFSAEGIIFENSFNQYVSAKSVEDVIVFQTGAKEGSVPRAEMKTVGDTKVQEKEYVERAAAMAILGDKSYFKNCKIIGRQDTLYGTVNVKAAFDECSIYGGTDYIFGGMVAIFNKCDLVFNTSDKSSDVGYITAAQQKSGRGYLFYNCHVTSTVPGVDTASAYTSKPGYFGRPWQANTAEAVFYGTKIDAADEKWGKNLSLIEPAGWNSSLSGESALSQEYKTYEDAEVDNSSKRASWATTLTDGKLKDGSEVKVATFFGDWNPFGAELGEVIPPATKYVITVSESKNGKVEADKAKAAKGDAVKLTVTADENYELDTLKVNDEELNGNMFTMPEKDVTVTATFKAKTFTITVSDVTNGTVEVDKKQASKGETVTVTAKAAEGYKLEAIKVNGTAIEGTTFTMDAKNTLVTVTFVEDKKEETKPEDKPATVVEFKKDADGNEYWYEDGVKQGTEGRGKEIYDPKTDAWYWLDAVEGGKKAVSKDVFQESNGGKWVRYDAEGKMVKGWDKNSEGSYYFDPVTGAMAKGAVEIDGKDCYFDEVTGIGADLTWITIDGVEYWYEAGVRQGQDKKDPSYRGKEIYDPKADAWFWLDNIDGGKKATAKDVYQESLAGDWGDIDKDGIKYGKWVRYDENGKMIKGWSADGNYYFDPMYGTMAKGTAVIDGKTYNFDQITGILIK